VPLQRVIESEWKVRSARTVEYRGSAAEEDTPRKPGTEHREGATIGRRKGPQTSAAQRRERRPRPAPVRKRMCHLGRARRVGDGRWS